METHKWIGGLLAIAGGAWSLYVSAQTIGGSTRSLHEEGQNRLEASVPGIAVALVGLGVMSLPLEKRR